MHLDFKEICRGEGKTYIRVRTELSQKEGVIEVRSVNDEGEELPCRLLPLRRSGLSGYRDNVLVVFTSRRKQTVEFRELDMRGAVVGTETRSISPLKSKWTSRFNGAFRKQECAEIRNFDWKGLERQSILTFDQYIDKENSFLLRGSLFASCQRKEEVFITVFDGYGNRIKCKVVFLSDAAVSLEDGSSTLLREFRFSVELPRSLRSGFENYCFFAGNVNNEQSNCFEALEAYHLKKLAEEHWESQRNAFFDPEYGFWIKTHSITESRAKIQRSVSFEYSPLFSIIVPLFKTPIGFFEDMVESVLAQTYSCWELVLINASPGDEALARTVDRYAEADSRIKVVTVSQNLGITENTNEGIKVSEGDFLSFFDHDDVLEPNILFEYVTALNHYNDIDLLYCDEDKLFPDGSFGAPMFKPDFSIDLLRDNNYICHMLTVRKSLHEQLAPADKVSDGAQDHNLALQVAERGRRIHHVPSVLYHWRISETSTAANASSKPYATEAGILAVQRHLDRLNINAAVSCSHGRDFRYLTDYEIDHNPSVSLIVLTQGHDVLREFLQSVQDDLASGAVDIVLVAHEDDANAVNACVGDLDGRSCCVSVVTYSGGFNYSRAINMGVERSSGEVLILLHDDVFIEKKDCFRVLLSHCLREEVGAVGPMVCDMDGVVQQAGLAYVNGEIVPLSAGLYHVFPSYAFRSLSTQNLSAVSAICMATRRCSFESIGGFDERFGAYYGDVDYCFRLQKQGSLIVYTPETVVSHRGSMARGRETDRLATPQYYQEKSLLLERWASVFAEGDPYFNRNLSRDPKQASAFKLGLENTITL